MSSPEESKLTHDAFLGGMVHLWQPVRGYRAGVDPVILAASVKAQAGQSVLELGCGAGAAILCLGARISGLALTGVEREPDFAALAARNGVDTLEVVPADINDLPLSLRDRQFDHVLANPPYYDRHASRSSSDPLREAAHAALTPLQDWVKVAAKRLKPKGMAHFIHRAERLPDLLAALPKSLGSVEVLPITSRTGRVAERVILRARKNGRGDFVLHAPLVMHDGADHPGDHIKDYTATMRAVLRDGAALEF
ncbi:MAG: methyltransferase [Sulfitobacter sp.]